MSIPIYLYTGFLDSGKSSRIQYDFENGVLDSSVKTLLILCEDGDVAFSADWLNQYHISCFEYNEQSEFTGAAISGIVEQIACDQIIIEYNGMWPLWVLFSALYTSRNQLFSIVRKTSVIDTETFWLYSRNSDINMRDKIQSCDFVVLNRMPPETEVEIYIRKISQYTGRAEIIVEHTDGITEHFPALCPEPYDFSSAEIQITDETYAFFCYDSEIHPEHYNNKTILLRAICVHDSDLSNGEVLVGRNIYQHCMDELFFAGLICRLGKLMPPKNYEWVEIRARATYEYNSYYGDNGLVLTAETVAHAQAPTRDISVFL